MGLNREKLFPDAAQRELQDATDAVRDASESLVYATRRVPLDMSRVAELLDEFSTAQRRLRVKVSQMIRARVPSDWRCLFCNAPLKEDEKCQKPECIERWNAACRRMGMFEEERGEG
jgi:hypothetical protein